MRSGFTARQRFGPEDGDKWTKYINWSKLSQLTRLISLDSGLCPPIKGTPELSAELAPLLRQVENRNNCNILGVVENPICTPIHEYDENPFEFMGFDLIDPKTGISALTNCGGFPETFKNAELSEHGLIALHVRAKEIKELLPKNNPDEPHAYCDIWAIMRMK